MRIRIVGIAGLWCKEKPMDAWSDLEAAFGQEFDGAEFVVEQEPHFQPWDIQRMRCFCSYLLSKHDDGAELLIIGHSMGGVIACSTAPRFRHSTVRGVATIFSPNSLCGGIFPWLLGVPRELGTSVVSFKGKRDWLVLSGTKHRQSIAHTTLPSDHLMTNAERRRVDAARIAAKTREMFFPERDAA